MTVKVVLSYKVPQQLTRSLPRLLRSISSSAPEEYFQLSRETVPLAGVGAARESQVRSVTSLPKGGASRCGGGSERGIRPRSRPSCRPRPMAKPDPDRARATNARGGSRTLTGFPRDPKSRASAGFRHSRVEKCVGIRERQITRGKRRARPPRLRRSPLNHHPKSPADATRQVLSAGAVIRLKSYKTMTNHGARKASSAPNSLRSREFQKKCSGSCVASSLHRNPQTAQVRESDRGPLSRKAGELMSRHDSFGVRARRANADARVACIPARRVAFRLDHFQFLLLS